MQRTWVDAVAPVRGRKNWAYLLISLGLLVTAAAYVAQQVGSSKILVGGRLTIRDLATIAVATALGMLLGAVRLRSLAHDLGHPLRFGICVRTVALSQAAGSFFFQIFGQLASRAFLLREQGVPAATTVLMTLLERLVGLLFLLALSGTGAVVVFGGVHIDTARGGADFLKLLCGLALAFTAVILVSLRMDRHHAPLHRIDGVALTRAGVRVSLLTAAIQFTTLVAFTCSAFALAPETDILKLAAASCIVMLASALPISFGGWGVREFSAVVALGAVGVPADAAFVSAFAVGVISLVVALTVGSGSFLAKPTVAAAAGRNNIPVASLSVLAWGLPLLTAVLVYFQLYLPMANGNVNVCLADPLILIGASLFLVSLPSGDTHWRIPRLATLVAGCTVVVMAGFVHGWLAFGSNAWAATKASGWFVLVGYALAAALIVRVGGETGRQLVFKTLIVAFLAIACLEYAIYASKVLGLAVPLRSPLRMEGFAQDPNAFAFQCLVVMALLLRTPGTSIRATTALGACLLMLFLSASRSGAIAAATMFAVAVYFRPRAFLTLAAAAGFAALAGGLPFALKLIGGPLLFGEGSIAMVPIDEFATGRTASNIERWLTLRDAFWLFVDGPFFGQGLGHFVEYHTRSDGSRLIIHSSYLWILAEFGLFGAAAFLLAALTVAAAEWSRASSDSNSRAVILILIGFATMSIVQDLLYQRLLWFVLGAALACAPAKTEKATLRRTSSNLLAPNLWWPISVTRSYSASRPKTHGNSSTG